MTPPDSETSPIFVIGTGRSGTTLLRMMLCAHPRIYLTHEGSYWMWDQIVPSKHSGSTFLRYYLQTFSFKWLRLDPRPVLAGLPHPLPRDQVKQAFAAIMRAKAAEHGKVRWGDKTPSHSGNLARIFQDYPDARVVRIVRDPRGVVRSFNRMPWAGGVPTSGAALCELERKQTEPFRDRLLEVRLEDLLADPRTEMGRVLDFVGEPWDDAVLDHPAHGPGLEDVPPVPWFQSATKPVRPPRIDFSGVDPVELRLIEYLCRKSMAQHGYTPWPLAREPSRLSVFWRWLTELPEVLRTMWVALRMAAMAKDPNYNETPKVKAIFRTLNPRAWDGYPGLVMPDAPPLPEGWDAGLSEG